MCDISSNLIYEWVSKFFSDYISDIYTIFFIELLSAWPLEYIVHKHKKFYIEKIRIVRYITTKKFPVPFLRIVKNFSYKILLSRITFRSDLHIRKIGIMFYSKYSFYRIPERYFLIKGFCDNFVWHKKSINISFWNFRYDTPWIELACDRWYTWSLLHFCSVLLFHFLAREIRSHAGVTPRVSRRWYSRITCRWIPYLWVRRGSLEVLEGSSHRVHPWSDSWILWSQIFSRSCARRVRVYAWVPYRVWAREVLRRWG